MKKFISLQLLIGVSSICSAQKTTLEWFVFNVQNSGLKSDRVVMTGIDKNGSRWFGGSADQGALTLFDGRDWLTYSMSNSPIPDNRVKSYAVDGTGKNWIGTEGGLVGRYRDNWEVFHTANSKIPSSTVNCISIDNNGNKWMGTAAGLVKFEGTTWSVFNTRNSTIPDNFVASVTIDENNAVWAGTKKGIVKVDQGEAMLSGARWTVFDKKNSTIPELYISALATDFNKNLWVGTYQSGLSRFDGTTWTVFNTKNSGLPDNRITCITPEGDGGVWIGTQNGLAFFDGKEWFSFNSTNSSLPASRVNSVSVDLSGNKWIGTDKGIAVYRKSGLRFTTYVAKYLFKRTDIVKNDDDEGEGGGIVMRGSGDPLKGLNVAQAKKLQVSGKYYSLIVGIDAYRGVWTPLNNAVNDAKAVEDILQTKYKFDRHITLYNEVATRNNIIKQMEWLVENVKPEDNVFIYYSGHGEFKSNLNKGYWVPVDAESASTSQYISNSDLQTYVGGIKSKHTLLVSDACFSGDIFRGSTVSLSFENSERYYGEVYEKTSRKAITSGGIEPVMDGGKEGHSVFAYYLLKRLKENENNYLDASQLYNDIKIPVVNNSVQSPKYAPISNTGDEGGQFVFIKK